MITKFRLRRWLITDGPGWVFAWERWDGSGRRRWLRLSANNRGHGWAVWVGPLGIGYVR